MAASELSRSLSKEQINQQFLCAVADGNQDEVITLLLAGADPNAHRCNDQTNAFMIAEWSGNPALNRAIMLFGGYLPASVIKWRLLNNQLNIDTLKQFLTISALKIRTQSGVIEKSEYRYLKNIVNIYKKHANGGGRQTPADGQRHDDLEQLVMHCVRLGEQVSGQSS